MEDYAVSHKLQKIDLLSLIEKLPAYRCLENKSLIMKKYLTLPEKVAGAFNQWNNFSENIVVPTS